MLINCTPHSIDIYRSDAPDVIESTPAGVPLLKPIYSLPPGGSVARITEVEIGQTFPHGTRTVLPDGVTLVEYGHIEGLPPVRSNASNREQTWYVVSLALALAVPSRPDLLIPWRQVRNRSNIVVGCRGLARPC
jgi:hypothetical protein